MSPASGNLFAHFRHANERRADAVVLDSSDGRSFTFADLDAMSARFANLLADLGLRPGDRVSVQVGKSPENLCLYLACLRAGIVFHPLNPGYMPAELEHFVTDAQPSVVVCADDAALADVARQHGVATVLTLDGDGRGSLTERAAGMPVRHEIARTGDDTVAALLYSSGTTGVPKGIMLTHRNLVANTATLVDAWGFTADDRLLHALPIFHVHGLFVAVGCALASGASMRWMPAFDAAAVARSLPGCTVMMGVPTYYTRLLALPDFGAEQCTTMRLFVSGSAPLLTETFEAFEARTGHRILERYGMTETNMNTSNPLTGARKPGTVGPPLPGVEVRVVDDEDRDLGIDQPGNLLVRGPNVFAGYWNMPDKTAADFTADGFFRTGDIAKIDADGYVAIVGRAKDLIISGGLNVYPKEIEAFIDDLPGVGESAVIGVPHTDFGEAVVAVVTGDMATLDEAGVRELCRAALAPYKVPKSVVLVDELPRNTMAKVQKNVLRERYADLFA